jgi:hypothetical protein
MEKYAYHVDFFVDAADHDEAGAKIKAKLIKAGFWACEDHYYEGKPGPNHPNVTHDCSFELMGPELHYNPETDRFE